MLQYLQELNLLFKYNSFFTENTISINTQMNKEISRLHFITYQEIELSASEQVLEYCAGGGNWVQLRIKDKPESYILEQAKKCKSICQSYNATFIINDHVLLAAQIDADGVHIGKNDISIEKAREILGDDKLIGATANTLEDIDSLTSQGADYIGLGPYKFTSTKKNLSPVLGIDGYTEILKLCNKKNINIPIIAIGGITPMDFPALFKTNIHGIALSSYLAKNENIGLATLNTLTELGKSHSKHYIKS